MDTPVVTTNVGYEGLGLPKDTGALLSMDSLEFSDNVLKLLSDIDFRNDTGKLGGALIRSKFSWEAIALKLETYLQSVQKV